MTNEDKQLLLKDLCIRIPYRTFVCLDPGAYNKPETCILCGVDGEEVYLNVDSDPFRIGHIKPYLRPMSSMTEEECITLSKLIPYEADVWKYIKTPVPLYIANIEQFDFFHRHHLDWRGLIQKGLALEAPDDMYKTE